MRLYHVNDFIGKKFNRLTIVKHAGRDKRNNEQVECLCDCGKTSIVGFHVVKNGVTKSCGCLRKEKCAKVMSETMKIHGLYHHPLYHVCTSLKQRCYNKKNKSYRDYGARGITVCDEWLIDFQSFYEFSISKGWEKGLQIDRINNNGNYDPLNCRFVTRKINCNNRKTIRATNTTGYIGVVLIKKNGTFKAHGQISGFPRLQKRGFKTAIEAALYRDDFFRKLGAVTMYNFPEHNVTKSI